MTCFKPQLAALLALGLAVPAYGADEPPADALQQRTAGHPAERDVIETRLLRAVEFAGEVDPAFTIEQRMESQGVSAVSVAVIRGGETHWRGFYGISGGPDTLFQAASMSKAVASVGIAALARERDFSLDADIMPALAGLLDPRAVNPSGAKVTLRGLLSHTNGASVSGFPGYAEGERVPTTLGVVLGAGGANTDPVIIDQAGIGTFSYSGGGYTLAQLWAETVSGESFAALMERLVFRPIGMTRSSFTLQPLSSDVARAQDGFDGPVPGGWNTYPEAAAAGLWTTPADYGRFAHALISASKGIGSAGIDPAVAAQVLRVVEDDYGLGVSVVDVAGKGELRFSHSGGNRGYRTQFNAYPARDEVIVVMTNAPGGWTVLGDIMRTAMRAYGWPHENREARARFELPGTALAQLAGNYVEQGKEEVAVSFEVDGRDLIGRTPNGYVFRMVPIGPETFIDPDEGGEITIRREGALTVMDSYGTIFVRRQD